MNPTPTRPEPTTPTRARQLTPSEEAVCTALSVEILKGDAADRAVLARLGHNALLVIDSLTGDPAGSVPPVTPTAPLTTAAEMAREWLREWILDEADVPDNHPEMVAALEAVLTTYAAQIRRDALNDAINIVRHDCSACSGSGHAGHDTECEYCGRPMQAIRALPPGSPSSQTDTGDSNV
jgi:hypothetical protein